VETNNSEQQLPVVDPFAPEPKKKLSTNAKVGIGCGIGCGVFVLLVVIAIIVVGGVLFSRIEMREGPNPTTITQELVGDWYWQGSWEYTFNSDNTGESNRTTAGFFHWWTESGTLYLCTTPESCGIECPMPERWEYTFSADGNDLTISGGLFNATFHYTRAR